MVLARGVKQPRSHESDSEQSPKDGVYFDYNMGAADGQKQALGGSKQGSYNAAQKHPFHDNADHTVDFYGATVFRNGEGKVCAMLLPGALPRFATSMAAGVLEHAVARTSLRSPLFGGVSPNSGIAGYFDYHGTPVEMKCRKTSFTREHIKEWPSVFPMIDYTSAIYKAFLPEHWEAQSASVPDIVRIHGSPFSTLTINEKFRTASHTDRGDFHNGYGVLAVLKGEYRGLHLALDDYGVCFNVRPDDVLLFDTHLFHSNTELEADDPNAPWSRLSCVLYYRVALGGPSCMKEYRERLKKAKGGKVVPPPVVDRIEEKFGVKNDNKFAPVSKVPLTPFNCAASACAFRGGGAVKLLQLHDLVRRDPCAATAMFGEPLEVPDGLPPRNPDQIIPVHRDTPISHTPLGGFSERGEILSEAVSKQHSLDKENLVKLFSDELVSVWVEGRQQWLALVKKEWEHQRSLNPSRSKFSWNNKSRMNTAFFRLCDVARQMMCGTLGTLEVSKNEEQSFWGIFAAHLDRACTYELGMPQGSVGMHKLNVKLKDYTFGGTRYLKDMGPEEQERRKKRKEERERSRRRGCTRTNETPGGRLRSEVFDYQTEDAVVDYKGNLWTLPEENAERLRLCLLGNSANMESATDTISVLIVLPRRSARPQKVSILPTTPEARRILENPAARRLLGGLSVGSKKSNTGEPSAVKLGNVQINKVSDGDKVDGRMYDFVIMQHVLAAIPDDTNATECLRCWTSLAVHCTFLVEIDLLDRRHYILKEEIQREYMKAAEKCFGALFSAVYSTNGVKLRNTPRLISLINEGGSVLESRFKFKGSPLNTVAFIIRRKGE